ncbi:MAG: hypothetical protein GXP08_10840 [Gammaproteobacteria bacterium]|nr:hypothetical protein [Gammaproteobacteria bacterium]
MDIEYWPLITNLFIGLFAVAPVIYVLWFFKTITPSHKKVLLYGIGLIAWGTIIFAWLSSGLSSMEATVASNPQEQELKDGVVTSLKIWVFIFPAVTLAIGANLLTHYILTGENT